MTPSIFSFLFIFQWHIFPYFVLRYLQMQDYKMTFFLKQYALAISQIMIDPVPNLNVEISSSFPFKKEDDAFLLPFSLFPFLGYIHLKIMQKTQMINSKKIHLKNKHYLKRFKKPKLLRRILNYINDTHGKKFTNFLIYFCSLC